MLDLKDGDYYCPKCREVKISIKNKNVKVVENVIAYGSMYPFVNIKCTCNNDLIEETKEVTE